MWSIELVQVLMESLFTEGKHVLICTIGKASWRMPGAA